MLFRSVEGLKEQLEAVLEAKPYLKDETPAPSGGNPPRGRGGNTDDSVEKAKAMASQRNQKKQGGYDPWKGETPSPGVDLADSIAKAVGAALKELKLV